MFENIERTLTIMLVAIAVKLDREVEQVKKRKKRSDWMKPQLKNIVMAAPVTMNSTLDNAGVLDPLLKFVFKN